VSDNSVGFDGVSRKWNICLWIYLHEFV